MNRMSAWWARLLSWFSGSPCGHCAAENARLKKALIDIRKADEEAGPGIGLCGLLADNALFEVEK